MFANRRRGHTPTARCSSPPSLFEGSLQPRDFQEHAPFWSWRKIWKNPNVHFRAEIFMFLRPKSWFCIRSSFSYSPSPRNSKYTVAANAHKLKNNLRQNQKIQTAKLRKRNYCDRLKCCFARNLDFVSGPPRCRGAPLDYKPPQSRETVIPNDDTLQIAVLDPDTWKALQVPPSSVSFRAHH